MTKFLESTLGVLVGGLVKFHKPLVNRPVQIIHFWISMILHVIFLKFFIMVSVCATKADEKSF